MDQYGQFPEETQWNPRPIDVWECINCQQTWFVDRVERSTIKFCLKCGSTENIEVSHTVEV